MGRLVIDGNSVYEIDEVCERHKGLGGQADAADGGTAKEKRPGRNAGCEKNRKRAGNSGRG